MKVSRIFMAAEDKAMAQTRREIEAEIMELLKRRKPHANQLKEDPELFQLAELLLFLRNNYIAVEVEKVNGVRLVRVVSLKVSEDLLERRGKL